MARKMTTVLCSYCGKEIERIASIVKKNQERYTNSFCNRECFHNYMRRKIHPKSRPTTRKFNYSELLFLKDKGYKLREISQITGMKSLSSISEAIKKEKEFQLAKSRSRL